MTSPHARFDASASDDPDGDIVRYDWNFGDGNTAPDAGAVVPHTYAAEGTYTVTLTVTDDSDATDTASQQVVAEDDPPPPVGPEWRLTASSDSNVRAPGVFIPASVQPTDQLVVFVTTNRAATLTPPTGWSVLGTVSDGTEVRSWVLSRIAGPGLAGTTFTVQLDAVSKSSVALLAYSGAGTPSALTSRAEGTTATRTHAAPSAAVASNASTVLRYYVDKGANAHTWALSPRSSSERPRRAAAAGSSRWPSRTRAASPPGPRRRSAPPLASRPRKPSPGPSSSHPPKGVLMSASTRTLAGAAGLTLCAVAMLPGAPGAAQPIVASAEATPQVVVSDPEADVFAPALSHTGRYVAHLAIRRGQTPAVQQVRRTDVSTGGSVLLNPSIDGGVAVGNYSRPPVISSNGTRVAYSTDATRLVAHDTNGAFDAFVRDLPAHTTLLASVSFDGDVANGDVGQVSLSRNGRYVAFTSDATDQVPGSTTTNSDVFRRDLSTGTTVQVTVRPDGSPSVGPGAASNDISSNGNVVAFTSYNTDLVAADSDDGEEADLFVRNMTTERTRWLSKGFPAGANPGGTVISPNGRWVSTRWDDGSLHLTKAGTGVTTTVTANGYALLGSFSSLQDRFVYMSGGTPYVRALASGVSTAIPVPASGVVTTVTISGNGDYAAYDFAPDDGSASRIYRVAL